MTVTIEQAIAAPPELVFELYTDAARLPEWQPGLRALRDQTGPLDRPGTSYILDQPGPPLRIEVLRVDRPRLHEQRASFSWFGWILTARFLADEGGGTRFVFEYRYDRGPRLVWRPMMRYLASRFGRAELTRMKHVAEQHTPNPR